MKEPKRVWRVVWPGLYAEPLWQIGSTLVDDQGTLILASESLFPSKQAALGHLVGLLLARLEAVEAELDEELPPPVNPLKTRTIMGKVVAVEKRPDLVIGEDA